MLPEDGQYSLQIQHVDRDRGAYEVFVRAENQFALGDGVEVSVESPGEVIQLQFHSPVAGQRVALAQVFNTDPVQYRVIAPDGTVVFENSLTTDCLLYTSPSPRDKRQSRMPSSA